MGQEEQEGNDERALCRFEFFEMMVRMGRYKYLESGKASNYSEALRRMLKDVLPS